MGVTFASGTVRARRFLASVLFVGAGASMWPAGAPSGEGPHPRVLATRIDDAITPVIADHLREGVRRAEREGYDAYVVELDTPGGLDTSMRDIVQSFLSAEVPVVVYVTPSGARAASAGAIITFAASVAAMAPGTVIGAATPVGIEGDAVERKVVNDAAALAESIAEERGRDVEFAVDTVRKGRSAPAREALAIGAVDVVAGSLPELLQAVDGVAVEVGSGERVTLRTAGAAVDRYDLGFFRRILQFLADPNLAFLLLSIGTLGLIYELATPGVGFGGVVGVVALILALFALSVLPVNAVGLLLMAVAAALFVAEVVAPGLRRVRGGRCRPACAERHLPVPRRLRGRGRDGGGAARRHRDGGGGGGRRAPRAAVAASAVGDDWCDAPRRPHPRRAIRERRHRAVVRRGRMVERAQPGGSSRRRPDGARRRRRRSHPRGRAGHGRQPGCRVRSNDWRS